MRVFAFVLLLAAGCAQVPASPTPAPGVAAAPTAETPAEPKPAPRAAAAPAARALASDARDWGGFDLAELQARGQRARELRAELRGGYERALMRLRGQFTTLPTGYRRGASSPDDAPRPAPEPAPGPYGWAPIVGR